MPVVEAAGWLEFNNCDKMINNFIEKVIVINKTVQGDLRGIKNHYLNELQELYEYQTASGQLVSRELLEALARLTSALNREVAVYLDRKGQVTSVALGQQSKVSLEGQNLRRGSGRLSKLRCIHTHPGGSGRLSGVDVAALHSLRFDCMVAAGVSQGEITDIWAGFIQPGVQETECLLLGPFDSRSAAAFDFLEMVHQVEEELGRQEPPLEKAEQERALVVGVELKGFKKGELEPRDSLRELAGLAEAAGAKVVKEILQQREKPDSAFYIGRGLAEELGLAVQALRVNMLVLDAELSGTQLRNLEQVLGCKVLDRASLILDIFAQRASSREGKLQVELAQLEYLLPRLTGAGQELSRLAGGIGTRGPGETKLEKDRRYIRRRILDLKNQLEQVKKQRNVIKASRKAELPLIALVGYTNAGKSTLRYKLLEAASLNLVDWRKEDPGTDRLFATLDATVRGITLPNGRQALLADTVGFIQKLPHQLISAFKATLEEVVDADLLLHVVDAGNPHYYQQMLAVEKVLAELQAQDKKTIVVYNKIDRLEKSMDDLPVNPVNSCAISSLTGEGLRELLQLIAANLETETREVELLIPHEEGSLLGVLYQEAGVREVDYRPEGIFLWAVVSENLYSRIKNYLL